MEITRPPPSSNLLKKEKYCGGGNYEGSWKKNPLGGVSFVLEEFSSKFL